MDTTPNLPGVIPGFVAKLATLVDGTLRVVIDIQPADAKTAFSLLGAPGTEVALAAIGQQRSE